MNVGRRSRLVQNLKVSAGLLLLGGILQACSATPEDAETRHGSSLIQYGRMHEAIGQQQHQGRVLLGALLEKPHFFGVAALAGL